MDISLHLVQK